jgi:hypothetical protein
MRNADDFHSVAAYVRDRINSGLFVHCYSVAHLHRPDTSNSQLPPLSETFPDKFIDGAVFVKAREEASRSVKFRVSKMSKNTQLKIKCIKEIGLF